MAYLLHLALALTAQIVWETTPLAPEGHPWIALVACAIPHALGALTRRLFLRGRFRAGERAFAALVGSPAALHAVAVLGGGWPASVEAWTGRSARLMDWPGPPLLLAILPFVAYSLLAIDARSRLAAEPGRQRNRAFQARMFAASLAPFVLYVLVSWAVGSSASLRLSIETIAVWNAAYSAVLLLAFAAGLPWLLSRTWETEVMPAGAERTLLDAVSLRAGFDGRRLYVWRTGGTVANAAILGLFPLHRAVLFSDLLLAQLDLRQLASVYAHEIGHAKKNHVLTFAAWSLAVLFGADWIASRAAPDDPGLAALYLLVGVALWALGFGWLSRRFELEADLFSLRLLGDPLPLTQALEHVAGPHGQSRTSWRHFSTQKRIEFLSEVTRDPAVGERLERKVRAFARIGAAAFILVAALQGIGLAERWPEDRVLLDLRKGEYTSALARAERHPDLDATVAALARRAGGLGEVEVAELERRARAALSSADLEAAGEWLDLGALRGDAGMALVREFLTQAERLPDPAGPRVEGTVPETWRGPLEQALGAPRR